MLFFFFKQKTAYEMRISDWSSDVCSSDLTARAAELVQLVINVEIDVRALEAAADRRVDHLGRHAVDAGVVRGRVPVRVDGYRLAAADIVLDAPRLAGAKAAGDGDQQAVVLVVVARRTGEIGRAHV